MQFSPLLLTVLLTAQVYLLTDSHPNQSHSGNTTDLTIGRQLDTSLFAAFLTSFPFFLTSPIQNMVQWLWSIKIKALIWLIVAVAAFKFFTRRKIRRLKSKKTFSLTSGKPASPQGPSYQMLDSNQLLACASCPLFLHYMQGSMMGYGGMQSGVQAPQFQPLPPMPDVAFPPLPGPSVEGEDELFPGEAPLPPPSIHTEERVLPSPDSDVKVGPPDFGPSIPPSDFTYKPYQKKISHPKRVKREKEQKEKEKEEERLSEILDLVVTLENMNCTRKLECETTKSRSRSLSSRAMANAISDLRESLNQMKVVPKPLMWLHSIVSSELQPRTVTSCLEADHACPLTTQELSVLINLIENK